MDLSNIGGMISGFLPFISYITNLFTRLIEILSSYLGIDITIPVEEAEGDDKTDSEVAE